MDTTASYQQAASQIVRDKRGVVIGRLEKQRLNGKTVARNARGIVVGTFDDRAQITRDARGVIVGTGNLLAVLLVAPQ